MKDYELLEQQVRVMKMAEKHGIDDWRKLVQYREKELGDNSWYQKESENYAAHNEYRFALGVVGSMGVFEGDEYYDRHGARCVALPDLTVDYQVAYWEECSWTPPAKDEPASREWQDVYKWMQKMGVRFEICQIHYGWSAISSKITFTADQQDYRIDLSQTPPDNWREIYRKAQEFGVKFGERGGSSSLSFNCAFTQYQLAAAKQEEPKPKTRKYLCFEDDCGKLRWIVDSNVEGIDWQRVPSEDKVVEVEV